MGCVGGCSGECIVYDMFHKFGDTLVETIMVREPFTMAYIAYEKFVLRIDKFGRLHEFGGCRIAETARSERGVVNLVGVNVAVEIATEGETVVGVVLSNARKGVIGTAPCALEVVLGASVVARHTSPTLALPRRKPLGTTSAKRHTLATHLLPLARQVVEVRGTAK